MACLQRVVVGWRGTALWVRYERVQREHDDHRPRRRPGRPDARRKHEAEPQVQPEQPEQEVPGNADAVRPRAQQDAQREAERDKPKGDGPRILVGEQPQHVRVVRVRSRGVRVQQYESRPRERGETHGELRDHRAGVLVRVSEYAVDKVHEESSC